MMETDKLLVRIGTARDAISRKTEQTSLDYMIDGVLMNCSVMLKEQKVVRCKDCKHWSTQKIWNYRICNWWQNKGIKNFATSGNWFCANGEHADS